MQQISGMNCWTHSRTFLVAVLLFFVLIFHLPAQTEIPGPPKREFRAVWVTTAYNLDWPSVSGMNSNLQKQEFRRMLDRLSECGMNAVVVQVRVAGDAFYPSKFSPWSEWLTGKQGRPPFPYYDPLEFMIEECHARNMEFHAWFNPYRAISHVSLSSVCSQSVGKSHPEWCFDYGATRYLNPGVPQVREHIANVVMEVVENYDVDGIHFDDYFYPYPEEGREVPDWETYLRYRKGGPSLEDWRRENVNALIRDVSGKIKAKKPQVKFGVSPFFMWRNQFQDPRGMKTTTWQSSYDDLYADTRKWVKEGWVDYIAPQLYRSTTVTASDYNTILNWWGAQDFESHLYIGHAMYRVHNQYDSLRWEPEEIERQCELARGCDKVCGNIFFRANTFRRNPGGLADTLRQRYWRYPALVPPMTWIDSIPPNRPLQLNINRVEKGFMVTWAAPPPAADGDSASYYIVYRFPFHESIDLDRADRILSIQKSTTYIDQDVYQGGTFWYIVTSVDRMHNESSRVLKRKVTF